MARPTKKGLDYFNIDTVMDDSVEYIQAKHGLEGWAILVKLWSKIYQGEGYFTKWKDKEKHLFSSKNQCTVESIDDVLDTCFSEEIFDLKIWTKYHVLTSRAIQKRYFKIAKDAKRKLIECYQEYCLLGVNPELTGVITMINLELTGLTTEESTQSKVKYNTVNERIEKQTKEKENLGREGVNTEFEVINEETGLVRMTSQHVQTFQEIYQPTQHRTKWERELVMAMDDWVNVAPANDESIPSSFEITNSFFINLRAYIELCNTTKRRKKSAKLWLSDKFYMDNWIDALQQSKQTKTNGKPAAKDHLQDSSIILDAPFTDHDKG